MKRSFRLWVVALGCVLLIPQAWYRVWIRTFRPVRPDDARVAFDGLARSPLERVGDQWLADLNATIPSGETWDRIRQNWGDPGYMVVALPLGGGERLYCLANLDLSAHATVDGRPLVLEKAEFPPYGYSADCEPVGLSFHAPPGAVISIRVVAKDPLAQSADLAIQPFWVTGTKDRLVGVALDEDLRRLVNALTAAGVAVISIGALFLLLSRLRSNARGSNAAPLV